METTRLKFTLVAILLVAACQNGPGATTRPNNAGLLATTPVSPTQPASKCIGATSICGTPGSYSCDISCDACNCGQAGIVTPLGTTAAPLCVYNSVAGTISKASCAAPDTACLFAYNLTARSLALSAIGPVSCPQPAAAVAQCTNLNTDSNNCGVCGKACTGGQVCTSGVCGCPAGYATCNGQCVNINTSSANCGACGIPCTGAGMQCCGGTCLNTQTNISNCGACGASCSSGVSCVAGSCSSPACASPMTQCGGSCTNTSSDSSNCGSCGNVCPSSSIFDTACMNSQCVCSSLNSSYCPYGAVCTPAGGQCLIPLSCPTATPTLCSGFCVDTTSNFYNCGPQGTSSCGQACSPGQTCLNGTCTGSST